MYLRREHLRRESRRSDAAVLLPLLLYCQQFMGTPRTDVTFVRAKNVVVHSEHAKFAAPKLLPPGFAHGRGSRFGHPDRGLREVREPQSRPLRRVRPAVRRNHRRIGGNGCEQGLPMDNAPPRWLNLRFVEFIESCSAEG